MASKVSTEQIVKIHMRNNKQGRGKERRGGGEMERERKKERKKGSRKRGKENAIENERNIYIEFQVKWKFAYYKFS